MFKSCTFTNIIANCDFFNLKNFHIFWSCFPSQLPPEPSYLPIHTTLCSHQHLILKKKKNTLSKDPNKTIQNKSPEKEEVEEEEKERKKKRRTRNHIDNNYSWAYGLPWSAIDIHSGNLLKKTDFSLIDCNSLSSLPAGGHCSIFPSPNCDF